jgi:hypothetical protein
MKSRCPTPGAIGVFSAIVASSAVSNYPQHGLRPAISAGPAHLIVFGTRSKALQAGNAGGKLDGMLSDLSRHVVVARPDHLLADLHSLSPAARFKKSAASGQPLVLVDAITLGNPEALKAALVDLGLEHPAVYSNDVGGWLPVNAIEAAGQRSEVQLVQFVCV